MNRIQKMAWFILIVTLATLVITLTTIIVLYYKVGMPRALGGIGSLGILGVIGFSQFIFKKEKGATSYDERDKIINQRAITATFVSTYFMAIVLSFVPMFIFGGNGTMPTFMVPLFFIPLSWVGYFVYSISLLVQYRKDMKGEK